MVDYRKYLRSEYIGSVNITPFTDVVLVILIVFMVSAPGILSSHLDILLPKTALERDQGKVKEVVALDGEGLIYYNEKRIDDNQLKEMATRWGEENGEKKILLNADRRVAHGRVVEILDILRDAGVSGTYVGAVRK